MRLELYSKQKIEIHPVFSMPRFYYNEQTWLMDSWKFKINLDFVYFYDYAFFCINAYRSYEDVKIQLKMSMKVQECLKDLI